MIIHRDKKHKEEESLEVKKNGALHEQPGLVAEKEDMDSTLIEIKKSELETLKKELDEEKNKSKDYFDRYLRLQAEFDNARKRMQREQQEFVKYANEGVIFELLSILDDLERSLEARETKHQDPEAFLKGIEMILSHLYEMLKKSNVRPIEAKGKIFDPNFHEALMQIESEEYPENTVVEELQKGYMIGDRVIRTTKAKVSKKKEIAKENKESGKE
jgi:molecular chaperone GrpE